MNGAMLVDVFGVMVNGHALEILLVIYLVQNAQRECAISTMALRISTAQAVRWNFEWSELDNIDQFRREAANNTSFPNIIL